MEVLEDRVNRTFAELLGSAVRFSGCHRETLNPKSRAKDLLVETAKIDRLVRERLKVA